MVSWSDDRRDVTNIGPDASVNSNYPAIIDLCRLSEHLKSIPDALESLISEKRLLQAAVLLVRSLKSINKQDMLEIGGVSDLRGYLVGQETVCASYFFF